MMNDNLIFDLGFHNGDDTDFYLKKGFKVIALEADPTLVKSGLKRFNIYIKNGKLNLINKAVSNTKGNLNFYIHPNKPDWNSCFQKLVESDGSKSKIVSVKCTTLIDLCKKFGVPKYLKIDIEGCEIMIAKQLFQLKNKPKYVSFETSKHTYAGIFSWLYTTGYKKFQLVNQLNNIDRQFDESKKTFEGKKIKYKFTKYSSGFFGKDLPEEKWISFEDALKQYIKYRELKSIDNQELALGWLDVHASL